MNEWIIWSLTVQNIKIKIQKKKHNKKIKNKITKKQEKKKSQSKIQSVNNAVIIYLFIDIIIRK